MNKIHFVLRKGIYPYRTGGMEIFNYYLIKNLSEFYDISYSSYRPLNFNIGHFHKLINLLRPSRIFEPLQILFFLIAHKKIQTVVYSFSLDHWMAWLLYTIVHKITKINYIAVIHYGKNPVTTHKKVYRNFFSSAKKVIAVSKDIKEKYDALYGINCDICYPLVPFQESNKSKETLRSEYNIPQNASVICMVGSLKDMKNPDTLLQSLLLFNNNELKQYDPYIVYAGDGQKRSELQQFASDHNLLDRVKFLGNVPKERVNEIFELSDIYVISSNFEGTSVSLLEAMFHKIPIIASDVQGIKDTVTRDKECLMFPVRDQYELKNMICKYLSDDKLRYNMAINAYDNYEKNYNYPNIISFYKKIL